jgi:hypothetical protein
MTDDQLLTRQAIAAKDRSAPLKVTGRLRAAIIEMVWKGSCRADAAKAAGMTDHSLREAFKKPHVKAFYLAELGTLRSSERAKTHHRMVAIRDQDQNLTAAVAAGKLLEQVEAVEQARPGAGQAQTPGLCIIIHAAPPLPSPSDPASPSLTIIDASPASGATLRRPDDD